MQMVVKSSGLPVTVKTIDNFGNCRCKVGSGWRTYNIRELAIIMPSVSPFHFSVDVRRSNDYMIYVLARDSIVARELTERLHIPPGRYKLVTKADDVKGANGRPYLVHPSWKFDRDVIIAMGEAQMKEILYD